MENLQELFEETVKDLYNAEKQLLKAMPKLMKAAQNPELKAAIETHMKQSEVQLDRLEEVAQMGGFKPTGKVCMAAQGLVEEAKEHLEEGKPGATLDAAIIACAQKNEHYEICSYRSCIAWAEALGNTEVVPLLQESLQEEVQTDELLTGMSEAVNASAVGDAETEEPTSKSNGKATSGAASKNGSGAPQGKTAAKVAAVSRK